MYPGPLDRQAQVLSHPKALHPDLLKRLFGRVSFIFNLFGGPFSF